MPAKLNEKKSWSEREKTKETCFVGGTTSNFVAANGVKSSNSEKTK